MADLRIDIASEFVGKKAFNKANKEISGLDKAVGKLGKSLAGLFAADQVIKFGKASVKAFAEDQVAATRLSKAVDNLGLSFANPQIASFIDSLSETSGVVDDELRPAMQALLTTTGSLAGSQKLLTQAIDISRGSGVELATVANDLAQAYVGNTKGLKKYNLGLTQAELKAASFTTIQEKLNQQFDGSSAAYLDTYAGKMQLLGTAAGEAKEAIGSGLIDSFKILTADSGISDLTTKIKDLGTYIGDFFRGVAIGFRDLAQMPVIKQLLQLGGLALKIAAKVAGVVIDPFIKAGAQSRSSAMADSSANSHLAGLTASANAKAAAKAEAAAKKRAQDLVKATKTNTAELKKQALTKKQSALFDLEQIGIVAALKGKISEEERTRLNLQLALITGNESEADRLSQKLANSIDSTGKLAEDLRTLPDANNPFKSWDAFLDSIIEKARIAASFGGASTGSTARGASFAALNPTVQDIITGGGTGGAARAGVDAGGNVYLTVNGSVVSDQDLVSAIEAGLQKKSLSGSPSAIGRIMGMFG